MTLLMAATISAHCMAPALGRGEHWVPGEYVAKPVVTELQDKMIERLNGRSFEQIDLLLAKSASGDADLSSPGYYYLAKAAYVAGKEKQTAIPSGISLSMDVNTEGVAYVTSYRLLLSEDHQSLL
jgi:hypothetical protein